MPSLTVHTQSQLEPQKHALVEWALFLPPDLKSISDVPRLDSWALLELSVSKPKLAGCFYKNYVMKYP